MDYTQKYQLCQWEETDRILMEDFNDMTEKLEALLAARNCRAWVQCYVGDGASTRTHTFPGKPYFIVITDGDALTVLLQGAPRGYYIYDTLVQRDHQLSWSGNTVTIGPTTESSVYIANTPGKTFYEFALLESDE